MHSTFGWRDRPFRAAVALCPDCGVPNPLRNLNALLPILVGTGGYLGLGGG